MEKNIHDRALINCFSNIYIDEIISSNDRLAVEGLEYENDDAYNLHRLTSAFRDILIYVIDNKFKGDLVKASESFGLNPNEIEESLLYANMESLTEMIYRPDFIKENGIWKLIELNIGCSLGGLTFASVNARVISDIENDTEKKYVKQLISQFKIEDGLVMLEEEVHLSYMKIFCKSLISELQKELGYEIPILDASDLKWSGESLMGPTGEVKTVFPWINQSDLYRNKEKYMGLKQAIIAKKTKMIMGPYTNLISSKGALALISEMCKENELPALYQNLIKEHLPETVWLHKNTNYAIKYKDELILKPSTGFGGNGIVVGREKSASEWKGVVETLSLITDNKYICQKVIKSEMHNVKIIDSNFKISEVPSKIVASPFVFNDKYLGAFVRAQSLDSPIIINHITGAAIGSIFLPDYEGCV